MILLQFSAAVGPAECDYAVAQAVIFLEKEAKSYQVKTELVSVEEGRMPKTFRSVIISLEGEQAETLASQWCGTLQWIFPSPYRHKYPRKNWFIGCERLPELASIQESEIRFEAMRASGAGGQHVNKTSSAIRATHIATGISVKVQNERSQHANKRLAVLLIQAKLHELQQAQAAQQKADRRHLHYEVVRGNAVRVFRLG